METVLIKIPVTSLIIEFKDKHSSWRLSELRLQEKKGSPHTFQDLLLTPCASQQHPGDGGCVPNGHVTLTALTQSSGFFPSQKLCFDTCVHDRHARPSWIAPILCMEHPTAPAGSVPTLQPFLIACAYPSTGRWSRLRCQVVGTQHPSLCLQEARFTHTLLGP